jgi:lysophospholipase L1-like esterase
MLRRTALPLLPPLPQALLLVLLLASAGPLAAQPKKIVAFGDSMTVGIFDGDDELCSPPNYGYPVRLAGWLASAGVTNTMVNAGECGEQTSAGVTRIDEVLAENPGAAVTIIMEGTNDLNNSGVGIETMVYNIHEMARKAQVRRAWPVVVAPPPREPERWGTNARAHGLSVRLAETAEVQNYDFLDLFEVFETIDEDFDEYYAEDGLHWNENGYDVVGIEMLAPTQAALARVRPTPCVAGQQTLCLSSGRFKVQVEWRTPVPQVGPGVAKPLTADTGYFWFFSSNNIELVVKVLDARGLNGHFWVFYGALSDVEYTITVTDSVTGRQRVYRNPQGKLASVGDIRAFSEPEPKP